MLLIRVLFAVLSLLVLTAILLLPLLNRAQTDGVAQVSGLGESVDILRDEKGMAYVYADNLADALLAQGYVTAQDRLFQMHMTRLLISGQLSQYLGEELLDTDRRMRTLGFYRIARTHAKLLDEPTRSLFSRYAAGVNEYLKRKQNELPLELKLLGAEPSPWTMVDSLAIMYYMGWNSAANIDAELLAQSIIAVVGAERFAQIAPLSINPDSLDSEAQAPQLNHWHDRSGSIDKLIGQLLGTSCCSDAPMQLGSNNWAISAERSNSGKPIVANDPHLQTDLLPSTFYPIGLITPTLRAVGVNVAGLPGIIIGRNQHLAIGATNAYADVQDLYIEQLDPDNPGHYINAGNSVPFTVIDSPIKIRDKNSEDGFREEPFQIRLTSRGPVVSGLAGIDADAETGHAISVRWSAVETMLPQLGLDYLLNGRSVDDVRKALQSATVVSLNMVFADVNGALGWQTTGRVPIRAQRGGGQPAAAPVEGDDWTGWLPYTDMPSRYQHPRGWVGTANHRTVAASFPHYYSNWFSPRFRYQRLSRLLDDTSQSDANDSWQWMRDDLNGLAVELAPVIAAHFERHPALTELASELRDWNHRDATDSAGALIFQETLRRLVDAVYADELGEELAGQLNASPYFWQERLLAMLLAGESVWFDDTDTAATEASQQIVQHAGLAASAALQERFGGAPSDWRWGDQHRMVIVNPLRRSGVGSQLLGGGDYAVGGSGETLYRGAYDLQQPHSNVLSSAALRMVVDLADNDKVMAVLPGGVSGRLFTEHYKDQISDYIDGSPQYWWYSDTLIKKQARSRLLLKPLP